MTVASFLGSVILSLTAFAAEANTKFACPFVFGIALSPKFTTSKFEQQLNKLSDSTLMHHCHPCAMCQSPNQHASPKPAFTPEHAN